MIPPHGTVYEAASGDCMSSIAEKFGHSWEFLWSHSSNRTLRELRQNPAVLLGGDQVFVPPLRVKKVGCATGQRHVFRRKGVPAALEICFWWGGAPRKNEAYRLTVDGKPRPDGTLDADGWLRVSIPCDAQQAIVVFGSEEAAQTYTIALGELQPVTAPAGVLARLRNLGYASDATTLDSLPAALARFQEASQLSATGEADDTTRAKLVAVHGS
jgi:hypothetical protein